jgi:type II secretory pathway pseudopilin PulG
VARRTRTTSLALRAGVARGLVPPRAGAARAGYTLAESLIASVVLAAAVVGISGTLTASYKQNAVRGNTTVSLALAQQLLEEIAARPVELPAGQTDKPGWAAGQTDRQQYDTIADYNGYTDLSHSVVAADGSVLDLGDGDNYTRSVGVTTGAIPPGMTGNANDFVMVTITIQGPRGLKQQVSQLFTRVTFFR